MPIGNLTSQLFANIYLNELDQFIKHKLKINPVREYKKSKKFKVKQQFSNGVKYYLRYCDDFVILDNSYQEFLESLIEPINNFLKHELNLLLHENKIIIGKLQQGIDFLGYVILPHYRVLRTRTKRRMLRRVTQENLASYLGLLKHCSAYKLSQDLARKVNIG